MNGAGEATVSQPMIDWLKWRDKEIPVTCMSRDTLTNYSNADACVVLWRDRSPYGGTIYRYGSHYTVAEAGSNIHSRSKGWFESFDAAALMLVLEAESVRAMDQYLRRSEAQKRRYEYCHCCGSKLRMQTNQKIALGVAKDRGIK